MNKDLLIKIRDYRISVAIVKEMLSKGLINKEEHRIICTILAGTFGLKTATIFSDIDLITAGSDGNITH